MFNERYRFRLVDVAAFDPVSLTAMSIGATVAGGGLSAMSTLAGGSAAKTAGLAAQQAADFKAKQLQQNAGLAIAGAQTKMFDTQQKTNMLESTSTARSAASGVDAGTGSAVENVGQLAKRGSYLAAMDLWRGQNEATGLENQAQGATYEGEIDALEGEEKQEASYLAAGGTLAGSLGSAFGTEGKFKYPTAAGAAGASA